MLNSAQQQNISRFPRTEQDDHVRRGAAAQGRVARGQVSRARHELTGAPLAPKNQDALDELRPQERLSPVPQDVLDFRPERGLRLDAKLFAKCPQSAISGCSQGPGVVRTRCSRCVWTMDRLCNYSHLLRKILPGPQHLKSPRCSSRPPSQLTEEGWRGEGHRDRQFFPTIGREDFGQTIQF